MFHPHEEKKKKKKKTGFQKPFAKSTTEKRGGWPRDANEVAGKGRQTCQLHMRGPSDKVAK